MGFPIKAIYVIANRLEQLDDNGSIEAMALRDAAEHIKNLEKALEIYDKERTRFAHAKPEFTGAYFISGESGSKDNNMLPEAIYVCPAYGCDWSQKYIRSIEQV